MREGWRAQREAKKEYQKRATDKTERRKVKEKLRRETGLLNESLKEWEREDEAVSSLSAITSQILVIFGSSLADSLADKQPPFCFYPCIIIKVFIMCLKNFVFQTSNKAKFLS